jgi:hypothetical protein
MANFEYYLELYSKNKQEQMSSAYQTAYRDLMAEYQEEVRVQELLLKKLAADQKTNAALKKSLSEGGGVSFSNARQLNASKVNREEGNKKRVQEEKRRIERLYEKDSGVSIALAKKTADLVDRVNLKAWESVFWDNDPVLAAAWKELEEEQKEVHAAEASAKFAEKAGGRLTASYFMENIFGMDPSISSLSIQAEKAQRMDKAGKETMVGMSLLEKRLYKEALESHAGWGEDVIRTLTAGADGTTRPSIFEQAAIKPPTEMEIRARAAEYYAPSGSKKFQKSMEEIAVEREAQAAEKKKARQQVVDSLPPWAGQVMKVSGDIEKMSKMDDAEIEDNDDVGVSLGYMTAQSDQFEDMASRIAHINNQASNDLEKQAALATLMSRSYRQYEQAQDNPLTDFINEE